MGLKRLNDFTNTNLSKFREIRMGSIKSGILYRSGHPISFADMQDKTIAKLALQARISTVLNLVDTNAGLKRKTFFAPWYHKLYKQGRIIALRLDSNITDKKYALKLKQILRFMLIHDGPYLIHCYAGIDRTGFVSALLEALMGANLDEIVADYLLAHKVNKKYAKDSKQYHKDSLVILELLTKMNKGIPVTNNTIQRAAEDYLALSIKLFPDEINALKIELSV
jgi:protein tyrosine/serine phosphatase